MLRPDYNVDRGSLELVTGPSVEPVTRDETKQHCRIDTTADDAYIDGLITGARDFVERLTRRAIITQTWRLVFDRWPGSRGTLDVWWEGQRDGALTMLGSSEVDIRKGGFAAITDVKIYNEDGTYSTWDAASYYAVTQNGMGRLVKKVGQIWPLIVPPVRQRSGIVITFTAGYGADGSYVPVALRQAIKDIVLHWYEVREAVGETSRWHPPLKTAAILEQFKVGR